MQKYFIMARFVPAMLIGFFWMQPAAWAEGPLVIVVHGVGGGNRPAGWANEIRDAYKIPPANWVEVNFNLAGRDEGAISTTDFALRAGEWATQVQQGITQAVKGHPGRKVMIVSHSWGTIATSIALNGGALPGAELNPIQLAGRRIARWVTLASPLGRANNPKVAPNLRQLNVQVSTDKPAAVDAWANIYDRDDPVSMQSHNLPAAENIEVAKSGVIEWVMRTLSLGLTTHTAIWLHPTTIKLIRKYYQELAQWEPGRGRIAVKVIRRRDSAGVAGARVVAMLRGGANSTATTDQQGAASLNAIPTGAYVVEATPLAGAGLRAGRASLELQDGENARLTITLEEEQKEKRELLIISATVKPEEGPPGKPFYFVLNFGVKGGQSNGLIKGTSQLEVRGALTLPFSEKALALDGAAAVGDIVKGTVEANAAFAKPGKYEWSYVVTAEGCATPLRGSVPFTVVEEQAEPAIYLRELDDPSLNPAGDKNRLVFTSSWKPQVYFMAKLATGSQKFCRDFEVIAEMEGQTRHYWSGKDSSEAHLYIPIPLGSVAIKLTARSGGNIVATRAITVDNNPPDKSDLLAKAARGLEEQRDYRTAEQMVQENAGKIKEYQEALAKEEREVAEAKDPETKKWELTGVAHYLKGIDELTHPIDYDLICSHYYRSMAEAAAEARQWDLAVKRYLASSQHRDKYCAGYAALLDRLSAIDVRYKTGCPAAGGPAGIAKNKLKELESTLFDKLQNLQAAWPCAFNAGNYAVYRELLLLYLPLSQEHLRIITEKFTKEGISEKDIKQQARWHLEKEADIYRQLAEATATLAGDPEKAAAYQMLYWKERSKLYDQPEEEYKKSLAQRSYLTWWPQEKDAK